jgi:hypothetical protein
MLSSPMQMIAAAALKPGQQRIPRSPKGLRECSDQSIRWTAEGAREWPDIDIIGHGSAAAIAMLPKDGSNRLSTRSQMSECRDMQVANGFVMNETIAESNPVPTAGFCTHRLLWEQACLRKRFFRQR